MHTIGAVGYLNALPLIHGLQESGSMRLIRQVPSSLLDMLESGRVDVALCPVIDYQRSVHDLAIVPSGAIGSHARTLTVRVFSRRPLDEIDLLTVDTDSHTSVALVQVIFCRLFGRAPALEPLQARPSAVLDAATDIQAALLIGDKVVTHEPSRADFPHQLDLGQAWRNLTGLPFVFATWLVKTGNDLGRLPQVLESTREKNLQDLESLTPAWAHEHGWPTDLALAYLRDLLDFDFKSRHSESVQLFWAECASLGLVDHARPLQLYTPPGSGSP